MTVNNWPSGTTAKEVYSKERTVLKITQVAGGANAKITLSTIVYNDSTSLNYTAKYSAPSGTCYIDITDIIRIGSGHLNVTDGSATRTLYWSTMQGVNKYSLILPDNVVTQFLREEDLGHFGTPLPSYLIIPSGGLVTVEVVTEDPLLYTFKPDDIVTLHPSGSFTITAYVGGLELSIMDKVLANTRIMEPECGKRYAALNWTSRIGNPKLAYFELSAITYKSANILQLDTAISDQYTRTSIGYDERRGEAVSCTLKLSGLSAFDIWYYSDVLQSNRQCITIGDNTYYAQLTTNKIEIPDGDGGTNDLELNYNLYTVDYD